MLAHNRYAECPSNVGIRQWAAVKSVMERKFLREYMDTPKGLYTDAHIWLQTFRHHLEDMLHYFAMDECDTATVAQVFGVDPADIESTLDSFRGEWDATDSPEDCDDLIDRYLDIFTYTGDAEDITLTKGSYNNDLLEWSYMGKEYCCQGEFFVDKDNILHHTFIASNGKEIEITTPYE